MGVVCTVAFNRFSWGSSFNPAKCKRCLDKSCYLFSHINSASVDDNLTLRVLSNIKHNCECGPVSEHLPGVCKLMDWVPWTVSSNSPITRTTANKHTKQTVKHTTIGQITKSQITYCCTHQWTKGITFLSLHYSLSFETDWHFLDTGQLLGTEAEGDLFSAGSLHRSIFWSCWQLSPEISLVQGDSLDKVADAQQANRFHFALSSLGFTCI